MWWPQTTVGKPQSQDGHDEVDEVDALLSMIMAMFVMLITMSMTKVPTDKNNLSVMIFVESKASLRLIVIMIILAILIGSELTDLS